MRTPRVLRGAAAVPALVLALLVAPTGCAAGPVSDTPPPAAPAPTPTVSAPADGVSLAALGFENGPADRVFVPAGARITSRVDQTNNVTVVLTSPSASDLVAFYRRTVPANGFRLTGDDPATTTLTFAGLGWTGTFTGDTQASALLLRPVS